MNATQERFATFLLGLVDPATDPKQLYGFDYDGYPVTAKVGTNTRGSLVVALSVSAAINAIHDGYRHIETHTFTFEEPFWFQQDTILNGVNEISRIVEETVRSMSILVAR